MNYSLFVMLVIFPPYGTLNSGEGAAIEYAVHALEGVKDITAYSGL